MGSNVSTSIKDISSDLEKTMTQKCDAGAVSDQEIKNLRLTNIACPEIRIGNISKIRTKCSIDTLSQTLAENLTKLNAQQQAGLGFNFSTDVDVQKNKIKSKLESKCGAPALAKQTIDSIKLDGAKCNILDITNKADLKTQCVLTAVADTISKSKSETEIKQKGFDPTAIFIIIAAVIGGLILLAIIYLLSSGGSSQQQQMQYPPPMYMYPPRSYPRY
jgi:hypothetical protein